MDMICWILLCVVCVFVCFFFQAEDGIRDAQESRGLGDVYKRQALYILPHKIISGYIGIYRKLNGKFTANCYNIINGVFNIASFVQAAVSYTHLTLPTIYSV